MKLTIGLAGVLSVSAMLVSCNLEEITGCTLATADTPTYQYPQTRTFRFNDRNGDQCTIEIVGEGDDSAQQYRINHNCVEGYISDTVILEASETWMSDGCELELSHYELTLVDRMLLFQSSDWYNEWFSEQTDLAALSITRVGGRVCGLTDDLDSDGEDESYCKQELTLSDGSTLELTMAGSIYTSDKTSVTGPAELEYLEVRDGSGSRWLLQRRDD